MLKAETLYYNGNIYSTSFRKFIYGYFSVKEEKILHIGAGNVPDDVEYTNKVDLEGKYVIPGLIDCHMHIESSMISPKTFAKMMVANGVTTVVSEPHEIANVTGIEGVLAMIEAAKGAVMDIYYAIPSSVPSTNSETETTGAVIDLNELEELVKHDEVICLGEVMNTNGILYNPNDKQMKFVKYLKEHRPQMPLEGHIPRIKGTELNQYVFSGINSDHTDHGLEEFMHRMMNGVFYQIQYITAKKEIVQAITDFNLYENIAIVTDDTTPSTLANKGHLNRVIMYMVELGLDFEDAVYCATSTPAKRMHFYDRGQLTPGMIADFVILDSITDIKPVRTYKNGVMVYDRNEGLSFEKSEKAFPESHYHTVKLNHLTPEKFDLYCNKPDGAVSMTGLQTVSDTTRTPKFVHDVEIKDGKVVIPSDINKLIVFERHGHNGNICGTIAGGTCVINGAVATSYAHDHHNLVVLGSNNEDMALAANTVIDNNGGFAVVSNGKIIAQAQLEVCGLMSERDPRIVAKDIESVEEAMRSIGYNNYDPIMSIGTLCLPVSMEYKLTDIGLVDVPGGKFVPVFND